MKVFAAMSAPGSSRLVNHVLSLHHAMKRRLVSALLRGRTPPARSPPPLVTRQLELDDDDGTWALVVDVDPLLLKRSAPAAEALFPPFFLVAVEAGSFARGLVLLVLYPVMCLLTRKMLLRAMAMVCFCGLRRDEVARIGRAVMPRYFFQEAADMGALETVAASRKEVKVAAVSRTFPTVMVEAFLKEYMGFDVVVGREVAAVVAGSRYLAGVMEEDDEAAADMEEERLRALLEKAEKRACHYPKPLVFHDGRLAFTPTPAAALSMYVYLPVGVAAAVVRIGIYTLLPRHVWRVAGKLFGVRLRVIGAPPQPAAGGGGRLYICNHQTLLDPVAISVALGKPVTAVTYRLSRLLERLSPIPMLRLTRERKKNRRRMKQLLLRGHDVVVCPEGTTCREPYVLRLNWLFTQLADEVIPVAVEARTTMFYGTSTSPAAKCFDSLYFLMNPRPEYSVLFMEPETTTCSNDGSGDKDSALSIQCTLALALGFEMTTLTRKHGYSLLAGDEEATATEASKKK